MSGSAAKGLRDADHILFVPLNMTECEMHIMACVVSHRLGVCVCVCVREK